MADLGSVGELVESRLWWDLGRTAWSLDRQANPVLAVLVHEQALTAAYPEDFGHLAGHLTSATGAPLARSVRAIHRASGRVIARTVSSAVDGAFALAVPPVGEVDLHLLAEPGDGCDLYLPRRTPVND